MRRMMLAVTGAAAGGMVLLIFICTILYQCLPARAAESPAAVKLPCAVSDTTLTVLQLSRYQGPFWEDRSERRVADTGVLLVENTGPLMISRGAVVLEWEGSILVFEVFSLPPGGRALVLEKDAQPLPDTAPERCYGWAAEEYPEDMGAVAAEAVGINSLAIINRTDGRIPAVQLIFKNRDPDSGVYIGGIAYSVHLHNLLPGERRVIAPQGYFADSSEVLEITLYTPE